MPGFWSPYPFSPPQGCYRLVQRADRSLPLPRGCTGPANRAREGRSKRLRDACASVKAGARNAGRHAPAAAQFGGQVNGAASPGKQTSGEYVRQAVIVLCWCNGCLRSDARFRALGRSGGVSADECLPSPARWIVEAEKNGVSATAQGLLWRPPPTPGRTLRREGPSLQAGCFE
jgi:hypothetical protein